MSSNLLYFNFTKLRQKTLETMNVLNLSANVNIALANNVIKQLKCRGGPLSYPLKLYQKIAKYLPQKVLLQLSQICVRQLPFKRKRNNYVSKLRQNYVRKLHQINVRKLRNKIMQMGSRNYVVITFLSYVRITL